MPDEMKAKAVEYALKYASTIAKQDVAPDYDVSTKWMERAADAGCADEAILYQTFANQTGITGNELVAQMYDVSDDARGNLILATYEDRNSITDPNRKGYKYTLDDNAKSRLRELYDEYFWTDYYDLLYYSGTYAYGDLEGRVSLLKKLGENVRKKARTQLASELSAAGYVSEIGSTEIELLDDYLNW